MSSFTMQVQARFRTGLHSAMLLPGLLFPSSVEAAPYIPKTWDREAIASIEVPLAERGASPIQVPEEYYYAIPERKIFKTYPVYAFGHEPEGYIEHLKTLDPEIVFGADALRTDEDWIRAGELVFDQPTLTGHLWINESSELYPRTKEWLEFTGAAVAADGTLPYFSYTIQEKGKVEVGLLSCAMCHTRVMSDGSVIKGAQGNFPFERSIAFDLVTSKLPMDLSYKLDRYLYTADWIRPSLRARMESMTRGEMADLHRAIPPGVIARHRTTPLHPVQVPDLIGVKNRRYLDRTGLALHRSIGDLMRYAALNQGADFLADYGGFNPLEFSLEKRPTPEESPVRYSDEQLYALALYTYSLEPPRNPNPFDDRAAEGKAIFEREGCAVCHTPPLYTNNKLIPMGGFQPTEDDRAKYDILDAEVNTDPGLAFNTRRGTGYYKVPSLKGVWYRGPFEHSGSVATLEDWFNPRRVYDDYVPTGFRGAGVATRAVQGHPFGLDLSENDRGALIAFLKTL